MDITPVFGTVVGGSSPSESTKIRTKTRLSVFVLLFYVRIGRIELPSDPWQGSVLPLNYTRKPLNIILNRLLNQEVLPKRLSF